MVVDHCRVDDDTSASSGVEGMCASPTEGTHTVLITYVCCAGVFCFCIANFSVGSGSLN